ncbi:hypothetical protein MC885_010935 [Smutsia gigantea]|nr:hypothetical protein MC885_010935 [Smutsia gigantea]
MDCVHPLANLKSFGWKIFKGLITREVLLQSRYSGITNGRHSSARKLRLRNASQKEKNSRFQGGPRPSRAARAPGSSKMALPRIASRGLGFPQSDSRIVGAVLPLPKMESRAASPFPGFNMAFPTRATGDEP